MDDLTTLEELAEIRAEEHGREYFKRNDLPGPGSTHDQIYVAGWNACREETAKSAGFWGRTCARLFAKNKVLKNKLIEARTTLVTVKQRFTWMGVDSPIHAKTSAGEVARSSIVDVNKALALIDEK